MRIWSLHPRHLDRIGLVACWRETLLAQAVLSGDTHGYRRHPQLERFRNTPDPVAAISVYLAGVAAEADARGYRFDASRIRRPDALPPPIPVTRGQLEYEWAHLGAKLAQRSPADSARWLSDEPSAHSLFTVREGGIEPWERPAER